MSTKRIRGGSRFSLVKNPKKAGPAFSYDELENYICASDETLREDDRCRSEIQNFVSGTEQCYGEFDAEERRLLEQCVIANIRLHRVFRVEDHILCEAQRRIYEEQTFTGQNGEVLHRYDPANWAPGSEQMVSGMLLGAAWQRSANELDRLHRLEDLLHRRYSLAQDKVLALLEARAAARREPKGPQSTAPSR